MPRRKDVTLDDMTESLGSKEAWYCPRDCGWYREWRGAEWWKRQLLEHRDYGIVSNMEMVQKDIENHNCIEYKETIRRLHARQGRSEKAAA